MLTQLPRLVLTGALASAVACTSNQGDDDTRTASPTAATTASPTATLAPTPSERPTPNGTGTLAVTFRIDPDIMDYMVSHGEQPVGPFWGEVFHGYEVTNAGPTGGSLASIYVEQVDLTPEGGPSAVLFVTDPVPNEEVVILGFMDSDANADPEDAGPDNGDPVTFPAKNRFTVVADQQTEVEVFFSLLNP